jgi:hypothetical protein
VIVVGPYLHDLDACWVGNLDTRACPSPHGVANTLLRGGIPSSQPRVDAARAQALSRGTLSGRSMWLVSLTLCQTQACDAQLFFFVFVVTQAFKKGEVVFRKGDPGDTFYIVQAGAFTVFDGARGCEALCLSARVLEERAAAARCLVHDSHERVRRKLSFLPCCCGSLLQRAAASWRVWATAAASASWPCSR